MKINKILIISLFLTTFLYSNLRDEFPSYSYVLTEFSVEDGFIDNPDFVRFINKNKRNYRERFIEAVRRGGLVIPTMKEMMYKHDISPLFIYISMIESEFNTNATSRTGAGGLWQFTKATGGDFNLRITHEIDERYNPIQATDAAIKYLYKMNDNLNSWYLTTMAYNCGNGCVNKSISRAGSRDLGVLINPKNNYIKKETRNYIQKILLMAMIGENYLFKDDDMMGEMMNRVNSDSITPVFVRAGEDLGNLANILKMDRRFLEKINPHLKEGHSPHNSRYAINIPTSRVNFFYARYNNRRHHQQGSAQREYAHLSRPQQKSYKRERVERRFINYTVKRDDSIFKIAQQHRVFIGELAKVNNNFRSGFYIGQKINIPQHNRYAKR